MNNIEQTLQQEQLVAGNIDEKGNVLYLDHERLNRKENNFTRYKNKPNGLGIYNFFKQHIFYLNDKRWKIARFFYNLVINKAPWIKQGGTKAKIYKTITMLEPDEKHNTGSVIMPLNVDITDRSEKVVIPLDMLKESLKNVTYIGGMDSCLCRRSNDCKDYPQDLGCLFLGEAGRTSVKHGLGRQLTYEEACARVDKAAELGLMAQGVWIEFEQLLWGVRNDEMDSFLEICFCCPCCCVAMRLAENLTEKERIRFHPSGWTAVADRTKCVGCGMCLKGIRPCPMDAISIAADGKVSINQETCVGCGLCKTKCQLDVIKIKQTMPMREGGLREYFDKEFKVDVRVWKNQEVNNE